MCVLCRYLAVRRRDEAAVQELLRAGASPNYCQAAPPISCTPLSVAVSTGCLPMVKLLLAHGADPNQSCSIDLTISSALEQSLVLEPLFTAINDKNIDIVRLLLQSGADVWCRRNENAVVKAIKMECEDIASCLSQFCPDVVYIKDTDQYTPWMLAAQRGMVELAKKLLNVQGLNSPDSMGDAPFHNACAAACKHSINFLLALGADANVRDKIGRTPIMRLAIGRIRSQNLDITNMVEASNLNARDRNKNALIHFLFGVQACRVHINVVKQVLESPRINVNARDALGRTALLLAVSHSHRQWLPKIDLLISMGANPNVVAISGGSLWHYLIRKGPSCYELEVLNKLLATSNIDKALTSNIEYKVGTPLIKFLSRTALQKDCDSYIRKMAKRLADIGMDTMCVGLWLKHGFRKHSRTVRECRLMDEVLDIILPGGFLSLSLYDRCVEVLLSSTRGQQTGLRLLPLPPRLVDHISKISTFITVT